MTQSEENDTSSGDRKRGRRKTVVGTVVSDKMAKTIRVDVTRLERHTKYQKFVRRRSTYYAHDEGGAAHEGDVVRIAETRPLSKLKRWRLVEVVRPATTAEVQGGEQGAEETTQS